MPNPQDIFQLAQQTATQVTASPENWRRFLYTAAHNYHTTYLNQLLIHAQRPDATACATMKYWNEQAHRKVMYGSKSIIILQRHQGVPTAKRVFSMTRLARSDRDTTCSVARSIKLPTELTCIRSGRMASVTSHGAAALSPVRTVSVMENTRLAVGTP